MNTSKHKNTNFAIRACLLLALAQVPLLAQAQTAATVQRPTTGQGTDAQPLPLELPQAKTPPAKARAPVLTGSGCQTTPAAARDQAARDVNGCAAGKAKTDAPSPTQSEPQSKRAPAGGLLHMALLQRPESARVPPSVLAQAGAGQDSTAQASTTVTLARLGSSPSPSQNAMAKAAGGPTAIPTLSQWALALLAALLGASALRIAHRHG